jgi:hypothetical protein
VIDMAGTEGTIGRKYKIISRSEDWRSFFLYTRKQAILRDLEGLGGSTIRGGGAGVEIWNPANPRGEIMPNMVLEFRDDGIAVLDLGGHHGVLMEKLRELVAIWQGRYPGFDLCLVAEGGIATSPDST